MKILYRAEHSFGQIEPVEIKSETPAFVTLAKGYREARVSEYVTYHQSKEDAKQAILNRLLARKKTLTSQIQRLESEIEKANAL